MFHNLFTGIFDSSTTTVISVPEFLLCVGVSLVIGVILAAAYAYKTRYNPGFVRTLAILPAVVCVVIMMVNGNVGTGVAVAGAFSLVRFRSAPGSATLEWNHGGHFKEPDMRTARAFAWVLEELAKKD